MSVPAIAYTIAGPVFLAFVLLFVVANRRGGKQ